MARAKASDLANSCRVAGPAIARGEAWPELPEAPEEWLGRQAASLRRIYRKNDWWPRSNASPAASWARWPAASTGG